MDRRALLAALAAGATGGLAGCSALPGVDDVGSFGADATDRATRTPRPTPVGPAVPEQTIEVANDRNESVYLTVVVVAPGGDEASASADDAEERSDSAPDDESGQSATPTAAVDPDATAATDSRTVFVDSATIPAGREATFPDVLRTAGDYEVVLETADGERATHDWRVTDTFDGLAVGVGESVTFRNAVRCGPDCSLSVGGDSGDAGELPLLGDGSGRWYSPATLVVTNPTATDREVGLRLSLRDETLFDYRYVVPAASQLTVPASYRSGAYDLLVTPEGSDPIDDVWRVPEMMERHVTLGESVALGCGRATAELRFRNGDRDRRAVAVTIRQAGERLYRGTVNLEPNERQTLSPVPGSGRYEVSLRSDSGSQTTETWWACPPHGPAEIRLDSAGQLFFRQELSG
ncbi:hypothetical protein [Salinirubrum litoreum]|uniref:Ig-like domain-containing protein n=1 Tax=Salinirubrum litoreum TaxID=1126234 RepID=A0ABD5RDJ2_9EURY|nr:hypothetical protein [Salinirubrum litoreum]